MLGDDLLIIPRWAKDTKQPSGNWAQLKLEKDDDGVQPIVKLRPGAIVPMGKVIQSTVEYKTDSITLLINPKADGSAQGTLYDDSGDGFEYQNGDYALDQFSSTLEKKKKLKVTITRKSGNRPEHRVYRIGYVTDGNISYSEWSGDQVQYLSLKKK